MAPPRAPRTTKNAVPEQEDDDVSDTDEELRARSTGKKLCCGHLEYLQLICKVFNPAPPPAIAPWAYGFAAPTPPYHDQQTCPIDWEQIEILHDNPKVCREAYELRRPWHEQPVAWDTIIANVDPKISAEGERKRFMAANKAVFKLTGVYFPESPLGLEKFGIPLSGVLKALLQGGNARPSNRKKPVNNSPLKYHSEAVHLLVSSPGSNGGVSRFVTKEVMSQLPVNDQHVFQYTPTTFDRWYTCVFQGRLHTFPRRLYRLELHTENSYIHRDEGTPSLAMSDLFETYRLSQEMGTTEVSDMILDEIVQSFRGENELVKRHQEGKATMQDCDVAVRSMSFDLGDVSLLWEQTEHDDPIRGLVLDILYHRFFVMEDEIEVHGSSLDAGFVQDWKAYTDRPEVTQCDIVQKFIHDGKRYKPMDLKTNVAPRKVRDESSRQEKGSLQDFCAKYHNHCRYGSDCFRSKPKSPNLIPQRVDDPRVVKVRLSEVEFEIEDRASYKAVAFDFERLLEGKPDWDWSRIRSIEAYIEGPLDLGSGDRSCRLEPTYYELSSVDANGRYQSHPGYQDPNWTPSDLDLEESDMYEEPWEKVVKRDIPTGATKYCENKILLGEDGDGKRLYKVTDVFFKIEDLNWYPPDDWKPDMEPCDFWPQEFRDYRRWLWVEEGGTIPRIEVKRFRPYEDNGPGGKDAFVDRKIKVSVLDIFS
jgi:hypothetical protein